MKYLHAIILLLLCFEANAQRLTQVEQYFLKGNVSIVGDTIYCDTTELSECYEMYNRMAVTHATTKYRLEGEIQTLNRSLDFQKWEYEKLRKDYEALVRERKKRKH